jgi:hypothetical protein
MKPLPCPFCGSPSVGRSDGDPKAPFHVRCTREACPGCNRSLGFADPELALFEWNRRVLLPPETRETVAAFYGLTTKSLMRGELVCLDLDRTGVLISNAIAFSPHSEPLMRKPRD